MLLLLLFVLDDDHFVRDLSLPGSEDDDDMGAFLNVGDGGWGEFPFSLLAAYEFDFGVLIDFEFLLNGGRRSGRRRCILVLVRTHLEGERASVRSEIGHSSMSRMKLLLAAARIGRRCKSGQGDNYASSR